MSSPCWPSLRHVEVKSVSPHHGRRLLRKHPARPARHPCRKNRQGRPCRAAHLPPCCKKRASIPERDMFNTFNMGVGMTVVVARQQADRALEVLRAQGVAAYRRRRACEGRRGRDFVLRPKIAVLVSGGGTNLQALLDAARAGTLSKRRHRAGRLQAGPGSTPWSGRRRPASRPWW